MADTVPVRAVPVGRQMQMTRRSKLLLYLVGMVLLLLSLAYVGARIAENWPAVSQIHLLSGWWLAGSFLLYAVSHVSTGLSWPLAVRQLGTPISLRDGFQIGLVTQIGKYLPGNIAHYVGRGALATQFGIPLRSSGLSTAIELGSAILATATVALIGLLLNSQLIHLVPAPSVSSAMIAVALAVGLAGGFVWLARQGADARLLMGPFLCLAISSALSGLSLFAIAQTFGYPNLPVGLAISAFAIAWVIGFVVPGSPAGLGVREAILLTLLTPTIGAGGAIAVTITHRIVTALVDAGAAFIGYAWLAAGSFAKK